MIIHKEGYQSIGVAALIFGLVNIISFIFISNRYPVTAQLILWTSIILFFFILSFFRIPNRSLTKGEEHIVCPADGKVVVIEEITDVEYFNDKRLQVSIFMSPANVHVNRYPISGKVIYNKYHKGKYLVAWHPKSSTENERHSIVIKNDKVEVLVKQIAGALAKRIVNYSKVDQLAEQGDEMGFIKFGSRVDMLLPVGTKINVELNQKVKGGVTVLATL
ncbi:MAG: phosphatidylserine decarboxylase family protein [Chitinophagaceae bacterium]|nr:phosphatidylserine decarboxylase family protein [Chitinophagaceae bacterium]